MTIRAGQVENQPDPTTIRSALERTAFAIDRSGDPHITVSGDGNPGGPIWVTVEQFDHTGTVKNRYQLSLTPTRETYDGPDRKGPGKDQHEEAQGRGRGTTTG